MEIKRNSWHYWVANVYREGGLWGQKTTTLCQHFWDVIRGLFILAFAVGFFFAVVPCLLYLVTFKDGVEFGILRIGYLSFAVSLVAGPIIGVMCFRRFVSADTAIKTPNILAEYLKAKKEKVCPVIYFD